jgi:hypothetical protein
MARITTIITLVAPVTVFAFICPVIILIRLPKINPSGFEKPAKLYFN